MRRRVTSRIALLVALAFRPRLHRILTVSARLEPNERPSGLLNVYIAERERRHEVEGYLREVSRRALAASVSPLHTATESTTHLDDYNLFWSHLALVRATGCATCILGVGGFRECELRRPRRDRARIGARAHPLGNSTMAHAIIIRGH